MKLINKLLRKNTVLVGLLTLILLQGCKSQNKKDETNQPHQYRIFNQVYTAPKGVAIWKAQLDKIIETNHKQEGANGLHILRYAFNKKINSLEELKNIRQNLLSVFPVKNNKSQKYNILPYKDRNKSLDTLMMITFPVSDAERKLSQKHALNQPYHFVKGDLSIVDLFWQIDGKKYTTHCFVSDKKGVVFDQFLNYIVQNNSRTLTIIQTGAGR